METFKELPILIVDDDENIHELYRAVLKRHGFRNVHTARSGSETLELSVYRDPAKCCAGLRVSADNGHRCGCRPGDTRRNPPRHQRFRRLPLDQACAVPVSADH